MRSFEEARRLFESGEPMKPLTAHEIEHQRVLANMARLRALRLAKEKADREQ